MEKREAIMEMEEIEKLFKKKKKCLFLNKQYIS